MSLTRAFSSFAAHLDKPKRSSPEWRSYQLGVEAQYAEQQGNIARYDRAEAEAERLVAASRTPELKQRHQRAWIAGKWGKV